LFDHDLRKKGKKKKKQDFESADGQMLSDLPQLKGKLQLVVSRKRGGVVNWKHRTFTGEGGKRVIGKYTGLFKEHRPRQERPRVRGEKRDQIFRRLGRAKCSAKKRLEHSEALATKTQRRGETSLSSEKGEKRTNADADKLACQTNPGGVERALELATGPCIWGKKKPGFEKSLKKVFTRARRSKRFTSEEGGGGEHES